MKVNILTARKQPFPGLINQLHTPPRKLYVLGNLSTHPKVAIIGSRKASPYGLRIATQFAQQLSLHGVSIVSGLAFGIDSAAHTASLGSGTVAILPGSVHDIYPRSHAALAKRILENKGCLISEHPPGITIQRHSFIQRNRLIAALSDAIVVVEAAERSGSLSTADFALQLGLPVLSVPGPIDSRTSKGTNRLLASGARPALSVNDVLGEIGLEADIERAPKHQKLMLT